MPRPLPLRCGRPAIIAAAESPARLIIIRLPPCCCLPRPAPQFERDEISEEELFRIFFADGRQFDGQALKQHMVRAPLPRGWRWRCIEHQPEPPPAQRSPAAEPASQPGSQPCLPPTAHTPNTPCMQADCYRYLDGMEALLQRLSAGGATMHAFSNYPSWWRMIEGKLELSRYLEWTFVSCQAPIKVLPTPIPLALLRRPGG